MHSINKISLTGIGLAFSVITTLGFFTMPIMALEDCTQDSKISQNEPHTQGSSAHSAKDTPDFIVHVELFPSPKQFQHPCFHVDQVVEASVDVCSQSDQDHRDLYESLWYQDGRALGLERKHAFAVPAGKSVLIDVGLRPCPAGQETKAAANAILRLVLDSLLNRDTVTAVRVPAFSFPLILMDLQNRNARVLPPEIEPPVDAKVVFQLQSAGSNMAQTIYFL